MMVDSTSESQEASQLSSKRRNRRDAQLQSPSPVPVYLMPQHQQAPPWKPEEVTAFLERVLPYADKVLQYIDKKAESEHRLTRLATTHDWRSTVLAFSFLSVIIGLMSWLTYEGRVSGDALLFLAGTAAGYTLSMVGKFRGPQVAETEE